MFYTVKEAIRTGHRLKLSLPEGAYIVEPHVLGRTRRGKTLLRAYELQGPHPLQRNHWKLFDLSNIEHAVETGDRFAQPRPGYRDADPAMTAGIIERV